MPEILNEVSSRYNYVYNDEIKMWVKQSYETHPVDVVFDDNTNLEKKYNNLSIISSEIDNSEAKQKSAIIDVIKSSLGATVSSSASWNTIIDTLNGMISKFDSIKLYEYNGSDSEQTLSLSSGTYQIELYGAQGQDNGNYTGGKGGQIIINNLSISDDDKVTIQVGGQGDGGIGVLSTGGGASKLYVNGILYAVAGGGGGAGYSDNGGDGGGTSDSNLCDSTDGEDGYEEYSAGGGDGYKGGKSGNTTVHFHDNCYIEVQCGGLLNYKRDEIKKNCGGKLVRSDYDYLYNIDGTLSDLQGYTSRICDTCGYKEYSSYYGFSEDGVCTQQVGSGTYNTYYECAKCEKTYDTNDTTTCPRIVSTYYKCNLKDGEITSHSPAYGGSNYYDANRIISYSMAKGANCGNGYIKFTKLK